MGPCGEKHSSGSVGRSSWRCRDVVGWTRESLGSGVWGGSLVWDERSGIGVSLQGFFFNGKLLRKAGSLAGKPEWETPGVPRLCRGVRAALSRPRGGSGERRDRPAHGTDERRLRPGLGWARERSRSRSRSSGKHPGSGGGIPHPGAGLCTRGDPRAAAGGCAHSSRPGSIPGLGRPVDPGAELGDPPAGLCPVTIAGRAGPGGRRVPPSPVGADTARRMPGPPGGPHAPRRSLRICSCPGKERGAPVWVGSAMGESRAQILLFWQVWDAPLFVPGANSVPLPCPADGGQARLERGGRGRAALQDRHR